MSTQRQCERCGRSLSDSMPETICPACLAQLGQATWLGESETEAPKTGPYPAHQQGDTRQRSPSEALRIRYFGDYELIEEIARGGMGTVYRARQVSLNRPVALKLISAGALATPELVKRFQAEAEVAASLTHPNIVPIHEIGQHDGQHYFSMGLVEGPSLRKHLNGHPMPTRQAAALMATVTRAVHYAHQRGVLHRDLKPSNIVLDREGTPHLTDFGLAKLVEKESTLTHTNAVMGTPSYMAPEQARGAVKEVTTAADVYGLGAVFYETLTGHPPFAGGTSVDTIRQVLDQDPRRPSLWNPAVDRDLETICLKCLEKEAEQRYASADALAEDLERWLCGQPILTRPAGPLERSLKWARRKPVIAGLVTAVMLVSIAGLTGILWQWNEAVVARDEALQERQRAEQHAREAAEREVEVDRNLYAARLNLVQQAWERSDVRAVRYLLEETATHANRGFEWYYWQRQANQELVVMTGPEYSRLVNAVAFSPDGQRVVAGDEGGTTRVWNALSGEELLSFVGKPYGGGRFPVAVSPDGGRIVTGGPGGTARVWEASTGEPLLTLEGHDTQISSVAFSPDGRQIVSGSFDQTAKIWNASTGEEMLSLEGHGGAVQSAGFSPDGRRVVTGNSDGTAKVWDAFDGRELITFKGHSSWVMSVAFSPDGQRIVSGSFDGTVKVWDASAGQALLTFNGHRGRIESVAFSPDGRRVVSGGLDGTAMVWDATDGEALFNLKGHNGGVYSVAFSPDGQRVATGGFDGSVRVWDVSGPAASAISIGQKRQIQSKAFSPDGERLVTGGEDGKVMIWSVRTGEEMLACEGHSAPVRSVAFSRDGQRVVTGGDDGTIKVWDSCTGHRLLALNEVGGGIYSVAFSPDGDRIVAGNEHGIVKVWSVLTGEEVLAIEAHIMEIVAVFSPDGQRLATASWDRTAKVWNAFGEKLLEIECRDHITAVVFSPDGGRIVTRGFHGSATVWDASSGEELLTIGRHGVPVQSVAFSPDGRRLVTDSSTVWDAASGQELLTLEARGFFSSVAFSSDGHRILAYSDYGQIKVWQAVSPGRLNP